MLNAFLSKTIFKSELGGTMIVFSALFILMIATGSSSSMQKQNLLKRMQLVSLQPFATDYQFPHNGFRDNPIIRNNEFYNNYNWDDFTLDQQHQNTIWNSNFGVNEPSNNLIEYQMSDNQHQEIQSRGRHSSPIMAVSKDSDDVMQRQLFPLFGQRHIFGKTYGYGVIVTSTVDVTSTVVCVDFVSSGVTVTPSSTVTTPTTPPTVLFGMTYRPTYTPPFNPLQVFSQINDANNFLPSSNDNFAKDKHQRSHRLFLETTALPEDPFISYIENNAMINDLVSSKEELFEESHQYPNYRDKRFLFRNAIQTTLTSYFLNPVFVTSKFIPNGVDCPPPGYVVCSSSRGVYYLL